VKHFAFVLDPHAVRVNAVAPSIFATDMSNFAETDEDRDYARTCKPSRQLRPRVASSSIREFEARRRSLGDVAVR
jgi:NAD(P)-dependent dehydrogenase (short-subunit alcohol dehydrogenase family)